MHPLVLMLSLSGLLALTGPVFAAGDVPGFGGKIPTVVEMFTSKYCPNCPSAEAKMKEVTAADPSLLVMQEHVDYWDKGPRKDPFGLKEITDRQYDYSNTVGRRPGEVFTPMPLLNGRVVATPPLWLNWEGALQKAQSQPVTATLGVVRTKEGGMDIALPAPLIDKAQKENAELWVFALTPVETSRVWRVRGLAQAQIAGGKAHLPAALMPKADGALAPFYVALLQAPGPGAVWAVGY